MPKDKKSYCAFCGADRKESLMLIEGTDACICDKCVLQAHDILEKELQLEQKGKTGRRPTRIPTPREIKKHLDEYVIGQDSAKVAMAVAVYNHYKRITQPQGKDEVEVEKSNILMLGSTGTGKTLMARTIARILEVPFCIVDATVLTEAGYVGEDVESILSRLLQVADYDVKAAESGIVYIDELDKIARKGDNPSITRDVSGEGVQQGMLKLLEGSEVNVPPQGGRKHPEQKMVKINTEKILFICGGAFDGIEKIIGRRLQTGAIGYSAGSERTQLDKDNLLSYVSPQDLRSFGLIPELIGRLPVITFLNPLDRKTLLSILTEPKNALIKQYQKLFKMEGIALTFEPKALEFMVDKAIEYKLGARGLRSLCEAILMDDMFHLPGAEIKDKTLKVTTAYARRKINKSMLERLRAA